MSEDSTPPSLYARLLCMPPANAATCSLNYELALCYRAVLLARALGTAATQYTDLLVHLSALARARQRALETPLLEASLPVLYADQALAYTATIAGKSRACVDSLSRCIQLLEAK